MNNKSTNFDLIIHADGGARGNPGKAAYGIVVQDKDGKILHKEGKTIGISTNNVAEYSGLIAGLSWLRERKELQKKRVIFFLDSILVVSQMRGTYKVKNKNLKILFQTAKRLETEIKHEIDYSYVPREKNKIADLLVNQALDSQS